MSDELYAEIISCLKVYIAIAPPEAVAALIAMPKTDLSLCHFGLGLYIRNNYLRLERKLYQSFRANGVVHPDDMSSLMVRIWHEELTHDCAPAEVSTIGS